MTPKTAALLADPLPKTHIVYPYSNFQQIVPAVARFIGEGIWRGESVVQIVTAEHRAGINVQLGNNDFDGAALERAGRIFFLDAEGSIVGAAVRQRIANLPAGNVRIYGEMVNELSGSGRAEDAARCCAAIRSIRCFHSEKMCGTGFFTRITTIYRRARSEWAYRYA